MERRRLLQTGIGIACFVAGALVDRFALPAVGERTPIFGGAPSRGPAPAQPPAGSTGAIGAKTPMTIGTEKATMTLGSPCDFFKNILEGLKADLSASQTQGSQLNQQYEVLSDLGKLAESGFEYWNVIKNQMKQYNNCLYIHGGDSSQCGASLESLISNISERGNELETKSLKPISDGIDAQVKLIKKLLQTVESSEGAISEKITYHEGLLKAMKCG